MTLDKAIFDYKEEARTNRALYEEVKDTWEKDTADRLLKYVEEQEQLVSWLIELKELKEANRWISVKERMPEPRVAVMIYCPSRKNQFCAYYDYELWHIFGGYSTILEEITHWKPLSQNPEESEDK